MKWRIGKVTVTKIVELEVTGGSRFILPQATYEEILPIGWLRPHFADERGRLKMSIHALVVETPDRRIIVDTCLGNDKQGRRIPTWNNLQGPFLADLAAAGFAARVDRHGAVHPSACRPCRLEHDAGRREMGPDLSASALSDGPGRVRPLAAAARARRHGGGLRRIRWRRSTMPGSPNWSRPTTAICDEISLVPTIGHTPGHVSVRIASEGEEALITGDFMHHPCQIARPEWSSTADSDPDDGARRPASACWRELCEPAGAGDRHAFRRRHRRPHRARRRRLPSGGLISQ